MTSFFTKGTAHSENLGLFWSRCPCSPLVGLPGFGSVGGVVKKAGWVLLVCHELLLTSHLVGSGLITTCFWPHMALHTLVLSLRNQEETHVRDLILSHTHLPDCTGQFATAGSHKSHPKFDSAPKISAQAAFLCPALYSTPHPTASHCCQNARRCTSCLPESCPSTSTRYNSLFLTGRGISPPATASKNGAHQS